MGCKYIKMVFLWFLNGVKRKTSKIKINLRRIKQIKIKNNQTQKNNLNSLWRIKHFNKMNNFKVMKMSFVLRLQTSCLFLEEIVTLNWIHFLSQIEGGKLLQIKSQKYLRHYQILYSNSALKYKNICSLIKHKIQIILNHFLW